MKKYISILIIILIIALFTFASIIIVKKLQYSRKNEKVSQNSSENVINSFFEYASKGNKDGMEQCFNKEAYVTLLMLSSDISDIKFEDLYHFILDIDKGDDYINKKYNNIIKKFEEAGVQTIGLHDTISKMISLGDVVIDDTLSFFKKYPNAKISNIKQEKMEYSYCNDLYHCDAVLDYGNGEKHNIEIWTCKLDGKYYIVSIP